MLFTLALKSLQKLLGQCPWKILRNKITLKSLSARIKRIGISVDVKKHLITTRTTTTQVILRAWSPLVAGDEQSYRPRGISSLEMMFLQLKPKTFIFIGLHSLLMGPVCLGSWSSAAGQQRSSLVEGRYSEQVLVCCTFRLKSFCFFVFFGIISAPFFAV